MAGDKDKHFEVKLVRSGAGRQKTQRLTLQGLGLKRLGGKVYLKDTPSVRGMLYKVVHLIEVTPRQGQAPLSSRAKARLRAKASAKA